MLAAANQVFKQFKTARKLFHSVTSSSAHSKVSKANEIKRLCMWRQSRRCDVTSFPIGWAHTRNDPCRWLSVIWGLRYKTLPGTGAGKSAKQTLCTPKWWYFCPGTATVSIVRRFSVVRALSRYGLALHAPSGFKYSDYIATIWNWSYFNVTAPIMTCMLILSHTVLSSEDWANRYLLCSRLVADQSC